MERSLVLGVDVGSATVKVALAELAEGEPQIIGVGMVPCLGIRRGMVTDLDSVAAAVKEAATRACDMAGRSGATRAVAAVSGPHVLSLVGRAEVPVHRPSYGVTPEDVRRSLDQAAMVDLAEGREVMHVVPRSYRVDGAEGVMDPLGLAGRMLTTEAHLITAEALPLQNHLRAVVRAGLEVADYQLAIRAAGEAVLTRAEKEAGVLLLDIGAGTTGVAVYDRGYLWHISVLPVGGEHITADIASLLQIPLAAAERLKVERGWASAELAPDTRFELVSPSGQTVREEADKRLAEIIESRVQEILQLAAVQVKRSGYAGLFPGGLVVTGGTARLNGLVDVAGDCLSLPARIGEPEGALVSQPEFTTAVGLVRWGARLAADEVAAAQEQKRDKWGRLKDWLRGLFR